MDSPVNFTSDQKAAVKAAQRKLHDLLPLFDKAQECGVAVDGYRAIAVGLQEQLAAIERNFMKNV